MNKQRAADLKAWDLDTRKALARMNAHAKDGDLHRDARYLLVVFAMDCRVAVIEKEKHPGTWARVSDR